MAKKKSRLANLRNQGDESFKSRNQGAMNFDSYLDIKQFELERFKDKDSTDYVIDILPYTVETDNHPNRKKGEETYNLDIWVHGYVGAEKGSYICMKSTFGEPCEICKEFLRLQGDGIEWDDIKHLYPSRKIIYAIKHNGKLFIYPTSFKLFEENWLAAVEKKRRKGKDVFPVYTEEEGSVSLEFTTTKKKGIGRYTQFDFVEIEDYDDSILEKFPSLEKLLVIPDQEKLKKIMDGLDQVPSSNEEDEENEEEVDKEQEEIDEGKEYLKQAENMDVDEEEEEEEKTEKKSKSDKVKYQSTSKQKRKKKKEKEEECPYDTIFGQDWDGYEHCDKCANTNPEEYEACKVKFKELEAENE